MPGLRLLDRYCPRKEGGGSSDTNNNGSASRSNDGGSNGNAGRSEAGSSNENAGRSEIRSGSSNGNAGRSEVRSGSNNSNDNNVPPHLVAHPVPPNAPRLTTSSLFVQREGNANELQRPHGPGPVPPTPIRVLDSPIPASGRGFFQDARPPTAAPANTPTNTPVPTFVSAEPGYMTHPPSLPMLHQSLPRSHPNPPRTTPAGPAVLADHNPAPSTNGVPHYRGPDGNFYPYYPDPRPPHQDAHVPGAFSNRLSTLDDLVNDERRLEWLTYNIDSSIRSIEDNGLRLRGDVVELLNIIVVSTQNLLPLELERQLRVLWNVHMYRQRHQWLAASYTRRSRHEQRELLYTFAGQDLAWQETWRTTTNARNSAGVECPIQDLVNQWETLRSLWPHTQLPRLVEWLRCIRERALFLYRRVYAPAHSTGAGGSGDYSGDGNDIDRDNYNGSESPSHRHSSIPGTAAALDDNAEPLVASVAEAHVAREAVRTPTRLAGVDLASHEQQQQQSPLASPAAPVSSAAPYRPMLEHLTGLFLAQGPIYGRILTDDMMLVMLELAVFMEAEAD